MSWTSLPVAKKACFSPRPPGSFNFGSRSSNCEYITALVSASNAAWSDLAIVGWLMTGVPVPRGSAVSHLAPSSNDETLQGRRNDTIASKDTEIPGELPTVCQRRPIQIPAPSHLPHLTSCGLSVSVRMRLILVGTFDDDAVKYNNPSGTSRRICEN